MPLACAPGARIAPHERMRCAAPAARPVYCRARDGATPRRRRRRIRDEAPPAVALLPQAPLLEHCRGRQCAGRRASSDECVQVASRPKRGDALRRGPTHRYSAAIASV
ncbi:hypothetical protein X961_5523 [Burkholderia pseudomallei MSHR5613]|nr:hypothetical protein X961_5523 [Burkholderia pseudomallei MSHR5613]